ncbi:MAG: outer membrane protein transport protein [Elusimicrobiales bacterium]|nr:outer membrane protein transport protein [Elusimicrobiales bacterium]
MKKTIIALAAVVLLGAASARNANAAGFRLPDENAAALGMANAFSAQSDDASAVWYNPAAMTGLTGTQTMLGSTFIHPLMNHENPDGTSDTSDAPWHTQPHAFATHNFGNFSLGLGITVPFGLSSGWAGDAETARAATYSSIKVINYNLAGAYKFSDALSAAVGLDYATIDASLYNTGSALQGSPNVKLDGTGNGVGANAAIFYKASPKLNLAASYRTRMKMSVNGTVSVTGGLASLALYSNAATSVVLPDVLLVGASYKATEKLRLNFDVDYTGWSSYDQLNINADNSALTSIQYKNWNNVVAFRIGGEYDLNDMWKVRAGYMNDATPVPDNRFEPRIPDATRNGYSAGVGFKKGDWTVDASYLYLHFNDRTVTNSLGSSLATVDTTLNGTWKSSANLFGLSVGYKF